MKEKFFLKTQNKKIKKCTYTKLFFKTRKKLFFDEHFCILQFCWNQLKGNVVHGGSQELPVFGMPGSCNLPVFRTLGSLEKFPGRKASGVSPVSGHWGVENCRCTGYKESFLLVHYFFLTSSHFYSLLSNNQLSNSVNLEFTSQILLVHVLKIFLFSLFFDRLPGIADARELF